MSLPSDSRPLHVHETLLNSAKQKHPESDGDHTGAQRRQKARKGPGVRNDGKEPPTTTKMMPKTNHPAGLPMRAGATGSGDGLSAIAHRTNTVFAIFFMALGGFALLLGFLSTYGLAIAVQSCWKLTP